MPTCRQNLIELAIAGDSSLIGECCHIVAESTDGPRGQGTLPPEERCRADNLILLCRNHHKLVDDDVRTYTVDVLRRIKADHETWVDRALATDADKFRDDVAFAEIIDGWVAGFGILDWDEWASEWLLVSRISTSRFEALQHSSDWLARRIWPTRYPRIKSALRLYSRVIIDLLSVFEFHAYPEDRSRTSLITEPFYKRHQYPEDVYRKLLIDYVAHVALTEFLIKEATKAGNLVCHSVRETIDPAFMRTDGALVLHDGRGAAALLRLEYNHAERDLDQLYSGLEHFRAMAAQKAQKEYGAR